MLVEAVTSRKRDLAGKSREPALLEHPACLSDHDDEVNEHEIPDPVSTSLRGDSGFQFWVVAW